MNRRKFIKVATSAVVGVVVAPKAKAYQSSSTAKSSSSSQTIGRQSCGCQGFSSCYHSSSSTRRSACSYGIGDILKAAKRGCGPKTGWRGPCGLDLSECPYPENICSSSTSSYSSSSAGKT